MSPGRPAAINSTPIARVACRSKNGGRDSQCVIDHGMSPARTLGAVAKKTAEPNTAIVFRTAPPSRPRDETSVRAYSLLGVDVRLPRLISLGCRLYTSAKTALNRLTLPKPARKAI